jgi:hypothetical protein
MDIQRSLLRSCFWVAQINFKYDDDDYMQKYRGSEKIQMFCKAELKYRPSNPLGLIALAMQSFFFVPWPFHCFNGGRGEVILP